jgi:hypothetical protein
MRARFIAAATIALAGLGLGIAGGLRNPAEATLREPASAPARGASPAVTPEDLGAQLADIRKTLNISPQQDAAWQRYATTMTTLEQQRRDFDARVARGEAKDDGTEYWRHQFAIADAINDLMSTLTPAQVERARPLTRLLAANSICRGLAQD